MVEKPERVNEMEQQEFEAGLEKALNKARKNHNSITMGQLEEIFGGIAGDDRHREILLAYFKSKNITVFTGDEETDREAAEKALTEEFSYDPKDKQYLDQYLEELSAMEKISDRELESLLLKVGAGDRQAQAEVLQAYLGKAADLARTYANQGILMEDLIGEANLALTEAVMELDHYIDAQQSVGSLLSDVESFLGERMMDAMEAMIREEMAEKDADQEMASRVNLVADAARELSNELGRKVSVTELAGNTELGEEQIREAIRILGNGKSAIDILTDEDE